MNAIFKRQFRASLLGALAFSLLAVLAAHTQVQAQTKADPQPVNVEADQMEVRQSQNIAIFTGNVDALRADTRMKSSRMVVHYASNKQASGNNALGGSRVTLIEAEGGVIIATPTQKITGDQANLDVETNILIVTGKQVVVTEGESVVKGTRLVADLTNKTSRMEGGRVSGSFVPGKKQ